MNKTNSNFSNMPKPYKIAFDDEICDSQLPRREPKKPIKLRKRLPPEFCSLNELETHDTALARDIVIGKKLEQPEKQCEFDNNDIKRYQNEVFSAEDKFNYSSRNAITPNDRLNEIFTKYGNELCNESGKTIADVYDGLVKNDFEKFTR